MTRSVQDLGGLLKEFGVQGHTLPMSPVQLDGYGWIQDNQFGCIVGFELWTDIWLPRLAGWRRTPMNEEEDFQIDNRALAACHTPRLNQFIAGVRELTLANGGEWSIDDNALNAPREFISESGIVLDAPGS